jgi:uncharacterized protein (DUF488 family)
LTEPFFTIGHSTRSVEELASLLKANDVKLLVDVRKVPRSRTNPQFNADVLGTSLKPYGLAYRHIEALGGLRGRTREVASTQNAYWENASFHRYADYALTEEFRRAFDELRSLGHEERSAIMCAEAVWWRCHRRIIADYLMAAGEDVFHIVSSDVPEPAKMTPAARPGSNATLVYPVEAGYAPE